MTESESTRLMPETKDNGNGFFDSIVIKLKRLPAKGVASVIGGLMVHLTLGSYYTYGNLTTYSTSYIRNSSQPSDLDYSRAFWITPIVGGFQGASMYFGGLLATRVGSLRMPIFVGGLCMSVANIISYWAIKTSFWFFLVTYGIMQGTGVGLAYASPLKLCCEWFPDNKGLINGIIVAGFGSGGAIFNLVITEYLNPNNLKPSIVVDEKNYFGEESILERVPFLFIILGTTFLVMQIIGLLLMFEKSKLNQPKKGLLSIFKVVKRSPSVSTYQAVDVQFNDSNVNKDDAEARTFGRLQRNFKPIEMVKTLDFIKLCLIFICNSFGITYIAGFWKTYGQYCGYSDQLLVTIGSISSVANGLGRIFWGKVADLTCFKTAMTCVTSITMALYLSLCATQAVGEVLYGFYIIGIFLSFSGTFSLIPTACARTFGLGSLGENFGIVFASTVLSSILSVVTSNKIGVLSWYVQFWIIAGFYLLSMIMALLYPKHTEEGLVI